jgi:hypothetical protein
MSTGPTKTAWLKFCFPARIFDDEHDDEDDGCGSAAL